MYKQVEQTFYTLSIFVLLGLMFVARPANKTFEGVSTAEFKEGIVRQFRVAVDQILVPVHPVSELSLLWQSIDKFYFTSSQEVLVVIPAIEMPDGVQVALDRLAFAVAEGLRGHQSFSVQSVVQNPSHDVSGETRVSLLNKALDLAKSLQRNLAIETASRAIISAPTGSVAGLSINSVEAANSRQKPWVTLEDNLTGQKYCVAIYNSTVNKYLGECDADYQ